MLSEVTSVQPLRAWADDLAARRNVTVPNFDPAESGVHSRVLLLMEAPGPMANASNLRPGSGFISVDNNDATAENAWRLRDETGLHDGVLHWNIVPWYLGPASKKPTPAELGQGSSELLRLLPLLPELRVVIASGLVAQNGWRKHVAPFVSADLTVIDAWHPSPLSMNQPGKRDEARSVYEHAASLVAELSPHQLTR
jgi:hypothetical protein